MVRVYTKANCPPCRATKKKLDQLGIPFEEWSAADSVDYIRALGYVEAPVVEALYAGGVSTSWSGYRPDFISQLRDTLGG